MRQLTELAQELRRIDGRGYKAYQDTRGGWSSERGALFIDHVQADFFAAPSKLRIRCDREALAVPPDLSDSRVRRVALEDYLARRVAEALRQKYSGNRGKSVSIDAGGQAVLERTALVVVPSFVEARIEVGLPAAGRKVLERKAAQLLCNELPQLVRDALRWSAEVEPEGRAFVQCVENQEHIRTRLRELGLTAFVADGSLLPRASGVSDQPLKSAAVPFESPESLRVSIDLPHPKDGPGGSQGIVTGMGLPHGVSLVVEFVLAVRSQYTSLYRSVRTIFALVSVEGAAFGTMCLKT